MIYMYSEGSTTVISFEYPRMLYNYYCYYHFHPKEHICTRESFHVTTSTSDLGRYLFFPSFLHYSYPHIGLHLHRDIQLP